MSHNVVTHSQPFPMPKQSKLLRRGNRYYLNARVPKDLLPYYGNQEIIRKALGTSDYREAKSKVAFEAFKLDSVFRAKRRELETAQPPPAIQTLSERDAYDLVSGWFIKKERVSEDWYFETGCKMDEQETAEVLDTFRIDEAVFNGGGKHYEGRDASSDLDMFLKAERLDCPKESSAYKKLVMMFTKARLENVRRDIARLTHQPIIAREHLFRDAFAHTEIAPRRSVTIGEMVTHFLKCMADAKRSGGTLRTYKIPCRLLREIFGERTPVGSITRERIENLFDLLRRAPSNATKRYRGLTLEQATAMADKKGDPHRLGAKTLENYYTNIRAIFGFAFEREWIAKNPVKDRLLRESFEHQGPLKRKAHFTVEEMTKLFGAPLYTQTERGTDGQRGTKRVILHEGKAWLPLLSLFHGLRSNEAAQLYTEDIKTEEGIPLIEIRKEREDGSLSEKGLKTKQSRRRVPIHPEILKMGFLLFVEERRKDVSHPRLFPDIRRAATGYFSDAFGKWFARFVEKTVGAQCKATFHSLRHQWDDALREAGVPVEDRERLGGWLAGNHSAERDYGRGPSLKYLLKQIQKVKYAKLNLSHLYL